MTFAAALVANSAYAQWGDLTIQFKVKGDVPKPAKLDVAKEPFCLKHAAELVDESLVVSKEGGLKNVIVSLLPGDKKVPVHPDYAKEEAGKITVDNSKCRFEPRVVTMRTTQTLVIKNSDPMGHNAKLDLFENNSENPLIPANGSVELPKFAKPETRPMPMSCSIHPWMSGNIVIREDPYVGVSDADGKVVIKGVPEGDWTFVLWHERPAYITKGTIGGAAKTWMKGRVKVTIPPGGKGLDMGVVELTPDQLKKK